jgi:hypothetical protein
MDPQQLPQSLSEDNKAINQKTENFFPDGHSQITDQGTK